MQIRRWNSKDLELGWELKLNEDWDCAQVVSDLLNLASKTVVDRTNDAQMLTLKLCAEWLEHYEWQCAPEFPVTALALVDSSGNLWIRDCQLSDILLPKDAEIFVNLYREAWKKKAGSDKEWQGIRTYR